MTLIVATKIDKVEVDGNRIYARTLNGLWYCLLHAFPSGLEATAFARKIREKMEIRVEFWTKTIRYACEKDYGRYSGCWTGD